MRLFFLVILGAMFFCGPGMAQVQDVNSAASALQGVLSNLKQSVEKLSLDNDQLAARDKAVRQQIAQLQTQLVGLQAQGNPLNKAAAQLQQEDSSRAQQIARLEEESSDLDDRAQKAQGNIKLMQLSLGARYEEDQKLLLQLKGMSNVLPPPVQAPPPESRAEEYLQKEKLKLMKMIYDSQQQQESLHEAIFQFRKSILLRPVVTAMVHQQLLKEQIKNLEDQIAAFPPPQSANGVFVNQWNDDHLRRLEVELKALEKNYLQLKGLMEQMTQKAQSVKLTVSQRVEEGKLQSSMEDLKRQGMVLKVDLDDLRSQMIDLDKRKTRLETMVQNLP